MAVLVKGLGPNTRVGQKVAGIKVPLDTLLLAVMVDDFNSLLNGFAKKPKKLKSIAEGLIEKPKTDGFDSAEELEKKLQEIRNKHRRKNGS